MRSQSRRLSPEGSFQGMPVSCTRRPGAWPTIMRRAFAPTRKTGRGPEGRSVAHTRQALASRIRLFSTPFIIRPMASPLTALSPLDGRYASGADPLRPYFSEHALIRYRVRVELGWLQALAAEPAIREIKPFSKKTSDVLDGLVS